MRLGDVCKVVSGATPKSKNPDYWGGNIKWVTPAELDDGSHYIADTAKHITEAGFSSANLHMLPAGTVLLTTRAPIGKVAITQAEMCCNQGFKNLICSDVINNEFLYRVLRFHSSALQAMGHGATFKELSKKNIESFELQIPSLVAQKNVVAALEAVERLILLVSKQLSLLDNLVKSRFVEMFGDLCEGETIYPPRSIEDLCSDFLGGGTPSMKHPEYFGGEIPFIKSGDVKNRIVCEGDLSITKEGLLNSSAKLIPTGAVIVVIRSGILKHTLPVALVGCEVAINQDIKALIPASGVNSLYLQWALLVSEPLILSRVRATTADNIETKQLRKYMIPLPPLALQEEFADFVAAVDKSRFVAEYNRKV
ncbi:restriction endonuclease subunit S [Leptogranulimonas caecicola]|uniref:Type I restriction endonuclease MjaXP subunit S n=1 Tax=Leptogranulimonas caecicola TaxID=2894156 RepID=A0AAU9CE65_9ACTN|nr:restriction endonuclease subunit S [Leptogranulimonas caecicola]BDC90477.1 type I restriction endonuclease MjaXP subunit S [Leptogranulimonas caecicola]